MKVYVAGPINGCTDEDARGWREEIKVRLSSVEWLDPMVRDYRGKEDENVDAIVAGDLADIAACDLLLVKADRASWGTAMETWEAAQHMGKPVVVWTAGSVSPWLRKCATAICRSVYEVESVIGAMR